MTDPPRSFERTVRSRIAAISFPGEVASLLESGLIDSIDVEGRAVTIHLEADQLDSSKVRRLADRLRERVGAIGGVRDVRVQPDPGSHPDQRRIDLPGVEHVVLVASSKGGVGKTTVATALAKRLSRGLDVGLFDADLQGPDATQRLGVTGPLPADEEGRPVPVDADGVQLVSAGLIENTQPLAWRGAVLHEVLLDLLAETRWGDLDVLVVDVPPGTGDVVLTLTQSVRIDGAILVTAPNPGAVSGAARTAELLLDQEVPLMGTVENMARIRCPTCGSTHERSNGTDTSQVDTLAEIPFDPAIADWAAEPCIERLAAHLQQRLSHIHGDRIDLREAPKRAVTEIVREEAKGLDPGEGVSLVCRDLPAEVLRSLEADGLEVLRQRPAPQLNEVRVRATREQKKDPTAPGSA